MEQDTSQLRCINYCKRMLHVQVIFSDASFCESDVILSYMIANPI